MKEKKNKKTKKQKTKNKIKLTWTQIFCCLLSGILSGIVFSIPQISSWLIWFTFVPFFYSLYSNKLTIGIAFKVPVDFNNSFTAMANTKLYPESIPDASAVFLLGSACLLGFLGLRRKGDSEARQIR